MAKISACFYLLFGSAKMALMLPKSTWLATAKEAAAKRQPRLRVSHRKPKYILGQERTFENTIYVPNRNFQFWLRHLRRIKVMVITAQPSGLKTEININRVLFFTWYLSAVELRLTQLGAYCFGKNTRINIIKIISLQSSARSSSFIVYVSSRNKNSLSTKTKLIRLQGGRRPS